MATRRGSVVIDLPIANSPIPAAGLNVVAPVTKAAPTTMECTDDVTVTNATGRSAARYESCAGHTTKRSRCC